MDGGKLVIQDNIACTHICELYTVVSRASAHSRVSAHVPNFKGSLLQLPYKHMEFISRVSTHVGQNRKLCLSAHGRLPGHYGTFVGFSNKQAKMCLNRRLVVHMLIIHLIYANLTNQDCMG